MSLPGIYKIFDKMLDGQTIWVISDTHFGDKEIAAAYPARPSDDEFIKIINSKCGKKDVLIHLGDVGDLGYVRKLRAKTKILIMGNHDAGATNYERHIIKKFWEQNRFTADEALNLTQDSYPTYDVSVKRSDVPAMFSFWESLADNHLFDYVFEGPLQLGEKLILSHEPIPSLTWAMNLHGHVHSGYSASGRNLCCDAFGYEPLNLNKFLKDGGLSKIETLHRATISKAAERKK